MEGEETAGVRGGDERGGGGQVEGRDYVSTGVGKQLKLRHSTTLTTRPHQTPPFKEQRVTPLAAGLVSLGLVW